MITFSSLAHDKRLTCFLINILWFHFHRFIAQKCIYDGHCELYYQSIFDKQLFLFHSVVFCRNKATAIKQQTAEKWQNAFAAHKKAMTNFSDISLCQISRRLSFRPRVFLIHFASWRRYNTQIYYINLPWQRQRTGIDTRSFVIQPRRKGKKNYPKFPCS